MRTIDLHLLAQNEERRKAQREAYKAQSRLRKQTRRRRTVSAEAPPPPNEYQLFSSDQPTGKTTLVTHYEIKLLNQALRTHFINHVNQCLDAGIPTTEHLQQWRLKTHANDMTPPPPAA